MRVKPMPASSSSAHKNPVSVAFGRALQRQRDEIHERSVDIADEMGIGKGYYRLIESGSNNLHVNKALNLVNAFKGTIELEAVIKILGSISIMEMLANRMKDSEYADGLSRACDDLGVYDTKLKSLLNGFANLFDRMKRESPEVIERAVIELELDDRMLEFLTDHASFGLPPDVVQSEYLRDFFDGVPSFYVGLLSGMKDYIGSLPTEFDLYEINKWVDKNKHKYDNIFCVIRNSSTVVHWNNIKEYRFEYLDTIEDARFIFMDDKSSAKELKSQFSKHIVRSYKVAKIPVPDNIDDRFSRVQFAVVNSDDEDANSILSGIFRGREREFDSAWLVSFSDGNNAGFLASEVQDPDIPEFGVFERAINITHDETLTRIRKFSELWEKAREV